ncbi:MAG: glycoside hydrolase family 3 protein, partial [Eubacterium sp.]|nr:glycoside hydrolase family 3 protein [Eubacterium sp.]
PHGLRRQDEGIQACNDSYTATCFPTASASACSWDTELIAEEAAAIAEEAADQGVGLVLGPGVNMKRSPLCGRNFEYFSEDPYLAGKLSAAFISAMQKKGIGCSLKHFAGNSQETKRQTSNSQIDERALHEIYLRAFQIAVQEAQPATVMASYNRLNGIYACQNEELLTKILRDTWGFRGAVISDWSACTDLAASLKAGMDLEMPGNKGCHLKPLKKDLQKGKIRRSAIIRAAGRVMRLAEKYSSENRERTPADYKSHHALAVRVAGESAVLLKNEGVLPLGPGQNYLVIGDLAKKMRIQGGGSSHISTESVVSAWDALKENGLSCTFSRGYDAAAAEPDKDLEDEALRAAEDGRTILFFGGLTDLAEGEGYDRKDMKMPQNQISLLERIQKLRNPCVFVSFSGSPYEMPFADHAEA